MAATNNKSLYEFARLAATILTTLVAAVGPPIWLYGHFLSHSFLFAPETELSFASIVGNVFAFSAELIFSSIYSSVLLSSFYLGMGLALDTYFTLFGLIVAYLLFVRGLGIVAPSNFVTKTIAVAMLVGLGLKWIRPVQEHFRRHPKFYLPVAFGIGVIAELGFVKNIGGPYQAKPLSDFGVSDWFAAGVGAIVYLAATIIWSAFVRERVSETQKASLEKLQQDVDQLKAKLSDPQQPKKPGSSRRRNKPGASPD